MKIALAQLNYHIGNFESNCARIRQAIEKAEAQGCDLVAFAELAVCGYPPLDFLDYTDFVNRCIKAMEDLAKSCIRITAIVGGPSANITLEGKNIYNSAYVLAGGRIQHIITKSLLPTYDVFDEYRWFESGKQFGCITVAGVKIALTVCEDLWNIEDDPLYISWPMDELIRENPSLMINIAASPFNYAHAGDRKKILERNIRQYRLPLLYINQVGAHTDIIFDGGSLIYNRDGRLLAEGKYFEEDFMVCQFNAGADPEVEPGRPPEGEHDQPAWIYRALLLGIRDYFGKMGFQKAIIGLSGGLDSALVSVLAAHALGSGNVHAVMMPSEFSSGHSVTDSEVLVKNLGISSEKLPIADIYNSVTGVLSADFKGLPFNVAEENIQARIRALLLMALSNKFGYILLNTSNKSEFAVGYSTLYGDMCGGLSVIGDVYKTEAYRLAAYINRNGELIPQNILLKPPSAELRPGQKDTDSLPPYDVLDGILFQYIEKARSPEEIIAAGFDSETVLKVLRMVNRNEYKRHQAPPILRVSPKAFGRGRRMPIVAKYLG
jgi:NAD+ synthase (glutamine-hydrolysing)